MRTRDIVRKLNNSDLLLATAQVEGNAVYVRNCKIKIPRKEKLFSWMSQTLLGKDYLKAYIEESIDLDPKWLDMLLDKIHETGNVIDSFIQLFEGRDEGYEGYKGVWEIDNFVQWMWLDMYVDFNNPDVLSHELDKSDLHTFHKKDDAGYEERFQYIDNWVEVDGKAIELKNLKRFTKYISGGMHLDGAVSYDPFILESVCDDRDRKIQLTLWEHGSNEEIASISEKQLIRVAHEYCEKKESIGQLKRDVNNPYEIWKTEDELQEWRVLKKLQKDDDEKFAQWFCAIRQLESYEPWEYRNLYVRDIKFFAKRVE